jgi:hypothetical protein
MVPSHVIVGEPVADDHEAVMTTAFASVVATVKELLPCEVVRPAHVNVSLLTIVPVAPVAVTAR